MFTSIAFSLIFHGAIAFIYFWHAPFSSSLKYIEILTIDTKLKPAQPTSTWHSIEQRTLFTLNICVRVCARQFTREMAYLFCAHIHNEQKIEATRFMRNERKRQAAMGGYSCIKYTLGNHHQHHLAPNKH